MSMIGCGWCSNYFDTDDGEGAWEREGRFRYKCENCLERDDERASDEGYIEQVPEEERT